MARSISPDSVSSKVADLKLGEHLRLSNPYTSVMVMVSNLKKKKENGDKLFKVKSIDEKTIVTRIK
jgi:hypothetical protein|tara:strand:- start:574 stop:771 length:198 start_codon:yes stop_codon:yes gene_type:complete